MFISLLIFLLSSSLSLSLILNVNKALLLVSCNTWSYHYKFILFMQVFFENKDSQINLCVLYEYFIYLIFMTLQGLSHERGSHHVLRRLSRVWYKCTVVVLQDNFFQNKQNIAYHHLAIIDFWNLSIQFCPQNQELKSKSSNSDLWTR